MYPYFLFRLQELIQWEIRDKEEHDKVMADQERNRTPKEHEPKINIEELDIIVEDVKASASAYGASVAMVTLAVAILKIIV